MKEQEADKLLNRTFNQDFKISDYSIFIKELFNEIGINVEDKTQYIAGQYREHISELRKIGEYKDQNRKKIEILAVKLKRTQSRDRARTMQRNFIANWLSKIDAESALVAFYGDEAEDWRFSFVKMEYNLVRDEEGKVKIAKELTPAKRYSYLVGIHEPNHTCRSQFLDLVVNEESNPSMLDIEDAFSIDNVTKEFFEKYKELVLDLKDSLNQVLAKDQKITDEFEDKGIETIDFAKKLLGQIVFIYFLQKKGWLGVEKDKEWGSGPRDFLRKLFGDKKKGIQPIIQYDSFFNEILEPLFYDALSNPRPGDDGYYVHFKCKIPFLNGGLFEPINDYDWAGTDIIINNSIFEKIFKTFDRFNFTVKEDEPLEKEVAVDPEMLGKVFENLLEVKERKDKGAFYTPREIVHYMCQQSLINYLETNTDINKEDIRKFIQYGDLALEHVIKALGHQKTYNGKSFVDERYLIAKPISNNFKKIDVLLKEIKIVDPAAGSGAFLVGMMNEIVKARSVLSIYFPEDERKERTNYNFKRETIENSLYGVDIDQSGVEIAKLRFWLSLIVDETEITKIKPLPNLDHKIMCGNSLLEEFEGIKLFDEKLLGSFKKDKQFEINKVNDQIKELKDQLKCAKSIIERKKIDFTIKKLKKKINKIAKKSATEQISFVETESEKKIKQLKSLQKKYFNEQNRKIKRDLRDKIDRIEWGLIEATLKEQDHEDALEKLEEYKKANVKPFFLWKLYFAEVFQRENPGFDVVIANPPYVEHKKLKQFSQVFKHNYSTYSGTADLYVYFYELGFNILKRDGVITYITSNKFIKTRYGKKLKIYLSEKNMQEIIDFTDVHVFEALVASCVIICKNSNQPVYSFRLTNVGNDFSLKKSIHNYFEEKGTTLDNGRLDGDNWRLEDEALFQIKGRLESKGTKIKTNSSISVYRGVTTGYNPAFIIDNYQKNRLINLDNKNSRIIKPLLQGRNIRKWIYIFDENYLLQTGYDINIKNEYPAVYSHLEKYSVDLMKRADQGKKWWNLRACKYYNEFEREKIIWGLTADKWAFAYDDKKHYLPSNGYILISDEIPVKLILAQLNSKVLQFYFSLIGIMTAGGAYTLKHETIIEFPLILNTSHDTEIIRLVDQMLSIIDDDEYLDNPDKQFKVDELEEQVNRILYRAYELTSDEINLIEESLKGSK